MTDKKHDRRNPPKAYQFKPGTSGNPKGRPKKERQIAKIIERVRRRLVPYRDGNRVKQGTLAEVAFKGHLASALSGKVKSAQAVLMMRSHAERYDNISTQEIVVHNMPPGSDTDGSGT